MIRLSSLIALFIDDLRAQYGHRLLPSHRKALSAMGSCRSTHSPQMLTRCSDCHTERLMPHSCGHRSCPHCQAHESQQWIERQLRRQVPADYYLLTFTIPKELRALVWSHQRVMLDLLIQCAWQTLYTFAKNDKQLAGTPGAIAVLHTHSRVLDFHPHVHIVMPAAAIDRQARLWKTKGKTKGGKHFLFPESALAKVFRGKLLAAIVKAGLNLPVSYPETWVMNCRYVGSGDKALVYLGRYLYRGVIAEKDIVACKNGKVTFRYRDSKTKKIGYRTVSGAEFLWRVIQHVLPQRFRRTRNFGFLHPNAKQLIALLQLLANLNPQRAIAFMRKRPGLVCPCCGGAMVIVKTRIIPSLRLASLVPG